MNGGRFVSKRLVTPGAFVPKRSARGGRVTGTRSAAFVTAAAARVTRMVVMICIFSHQRCSAHCVNVTRCGVNAIGVNTPLGRSTRLSVKLSHSHLQHRANASKFEVGTGALRRPRRVSAAQCWTNFTPWGHERFRPLLRGRGHLSAMSLPAGAFPDPLPSGVQLAPSQGRRI